MGCGEKLKQLKDLGQKITGVECTGEDIDDVLCNIKNNVPFTAIKTNYAYDELNNINNFNDLYSKIEETGVTDSSLIIWNGCNIILNAYANGEIKKINILITSEGAVWENTCDENDDITCKKYVFKNIPPDLSLKRTITITEDEQQITPVLGTTFLNAYGLSGTGYIKILTGGKVVVVGAIASTDTVNSAFVTSFTYMFGSDDYFDIMGGSKYLIFNDGNVITITQCGDI